MSNQPSTSSSPVSAQTLKKIMQDAVSRRSGDAATVSGSNPGTPSSSVHAPRVAVGIKSGAAYPAPIAKSTTAPVVVPVGARSAMTGAGAGGGLTRTDVEAMIQDAVDELQIANRRQIKLAMDDHVPKTVFERFCKETQAKLTTLEDEVRKLQEHVAKGFLTVNTELDQVKRDMATHVRTSITKIEQMVKDENDVVKTGMNVLEARFDTVELMCNKTQMEIANVVGMISTSAGPAIITGSTVAPAAAGSTGSVVPSTVSATSIGSTVGPAAAGGTTSAGPCTVSTTGIGSASTSPVGGGAVSISSVATVVIGFTDDEMVKSEDISELKATHSDVVSGLEKLVCNIYQSLKNEALTAVDFELLIQGTRFQPSVLARVGPSTSIENDADLNPDWLFPKTGQSMEKTLDIITSKLVNQTEDDVTRFWEKNMTVIVENLFVFTNDMEVKNFRDALVTMRGKAAGGAGSGAP